MYSHILSILTSRKLSTLCLYIPESNRKLRRPRRRWEDNIRMDLQEVKCWGMDWIDLVQDRDRWRALMNAGNFLTSLEAVSFSRRTLLHGVSK